MADRSDSDAGTNSVMELSGDALRQLPSSNIPDDCVVVRFEDGDPENPYNWSTKKKAFIVVAGMLQVINSTLGSSIPSGALTEISEAFHTTSSQQLPLPISGYLIGYVVGPLVFGPLSETYGRRWVMFFSFCAFCIWTLASAVAPTFASLCLFRLFTGIAASSPIVVIGGLYADIFEGAATRGKAMAIFMACTTWGPCLAPIVSGYLAVIGWRWIFWFALIVAGASFPLLAFIPETYGPVLLRKRAQKLRKQHPDKKYLAMIELEPTEFWDIVTRVIYRPISMILHESIVSFSCIYLSLIYSIFYLFFEAYPIIFQEMYGLSAGEAGLAFLAIAVGSVLAYFVFLLYDAYLRRAQAQNRPWAMKNEYQRLPLALLGGPSLSIGVFWLAWAAWPQLSPIVPILAGVPFGLGFLLIFMALINYLADAYDIYSASALAATSTTRSIFGAVLPLAADPMYRRLGIHWATTLLGFASAAMILIPIAFIKFGPYLREHSKFSKELQAIKEKEQRRLDKERARRTRQNGSADVEKQLESGTTADVEKQLESGASEEPASRTE